MGRGGCEEEGTGGEKRQNRRGRGLPTVATARRHLRRARRRSVSSRIPILKTLAAFWGSWKNHRRVARAFTPYRKEEAGIVPLNVGYGGQKPMQRLIRSGREGQSPPLCGTEAAISAVSRAFGTASSLKTHCTSRNSLVVRAQSSLACRGTRYGLRQYVVPLDCALTVTCFARLR